MSLTSEEKYWHIVYEELPKDTRDVVDAAYDAAVKVVTTSGFVAGQDDRAEALVAALTKYLLASQKG